MSVSTVDELNDDELALLGAPWAKEGLLSHKLYMESSSKRAKKSEWKQFFTVVQNGELYMFVFGSGSGFSGGSVGGGNWLVCHSAFHIGPHLQRIRMFELIYSKMPSLSVPST